MADLPDSGTPQQERVMPTHGNPSACLFTIHIRNFPASWDQSDLLDLFSVPTPVASLRRLDAKDHPFAFADYFDEEDARTAIRMYHNYNCGMERLNVAPAKDATWATADETRRPPGRSLGHFSSNHTFGGRISTSVSQPSGRGSSGTGVVSPMRARSRNVQAVGTSGIPGRSPHQTISPDSESDQSPPIPNTAAFGLESEDSEIRQKTRRLRDALFKAAKEKYGAGEASNIVSDILKKIADCPLDEYTIPDTDGRPAETGRGAIGDLPRRAEIGAVPSAYVQSFIDEAHVNTLLERLPYPEHILNAMEASRSGDVCEAATAVSQGAPKPGSVKEDYEKRFGGNPALDEKFKSLGIAPTARKSEALKIPFFSSYKSTTPKKTDDSSTQSTPPGGRLKGGTDPAQQGQGGSGSEYTGKILVKICKAAGEHVPFHDSNQMQVHAPKYSKFEYLVHVTRLPGGLCTKVLVSGTRMGCFPRDYLPLKGFTDFPPEDKFALKDFPDVYFERERRKDVVDRS